MENPNPLVIQISNSLPFQPKPISLTDQVSASTIYELIRGINDPEHPLTLEQLNVVNREHIECTPDHRILVYYTPTIPHCSMATLIGLCIRIQLYRMLPPRYMIDVKIREGTHVSEEQINKQLGDKERVAAAIENPHLSSIVLQCLEGPARPGIAL